jgi:spermidine synthase
MPKSKKALFELQRKEYVVIKRWFFFFFLLSGFCSLIYQVVWLRLAMASYGVTTPMISIVLSIFMAGLALGSWGAGRLSKIVNQKPRLAVWSYAFAELFIGSSAFVVPKGLQAGRSLIQAGEGTAWGSLGHYLTAGGLVSATMLPYTICMGATIPLAMFALRQCEDSNRSFSFLYLANVIGATLGTLCSAYIFIEILGFTHTLLLAGMGNILLAGGAIVLSQSFAESVSESPDCKIQTENKPKREILFFLFATGLISMGLEVIWTRLYTPFIGTEVYAFASILALYLVATFTGSWLYRKVSTLDIIKPNLSTIWSVCGLFAFIALLGADPRLIQLNKSARVFIGVGFFSCTLGFLTPMLVDTWSKGDGLRAGSAYAMNVVGCIVGPLFAGFVLLPTIGERWSIAVLAVPCFLIAFYGIIRDKIHSASSPTHGWKFLGLCAVISIIVVVYTQDYTSIFKKHEIRRDYTATAVATGEGMDRQLYINGVGITYLTPITKIMAHLPLAMLPAAPRNGLVICFGMGTSFRSMHSWGIQSTAVELVPSVPGLFFYFHNDADAILHSPASHIVIDDGRRFLERTHENFDVITIDPPPPVPAAGSSLLYSRQFYTLVKKRLAPDGIVQQWIPGGDPSSVASFCKAFVESFPFTKFYSSVEGWGIHCLAGMRPLPPFDPKSLAQKIPADAIHDLLEWTPKRTAAQLFEQMHEISYDSISLLRPAAPALEDDRPVNEYYFLREQLRNITMQ